MVKWFTLAFTLLTYNNRFVLGQDALSPKMLSESVPAGRRLRRLQDANTTPEEHTISMVAVEECLAGKSLVFDVSAGEGKGMVGIMENPSKVDIYMELSAGDLTLDTTKQVNVFSSL